MNDGAGEKDQGKDGDRQFLGICDEEKDKIYIICSFLTEDKKQYQEKKEKN